MTAVAVNPPRDHGFLAADDPLRLFLEVRELIDADQRATLELEKRRAARRRALEREQELELRLADEARAAENNSLEREYQRVLAELCTSIEPRRKSVLTHFERVTSQVEAEYKTGTRRNEKTLSDARYEASMVFEASKQASKESFAKIGARLEDEFERIEGLRQAVHHHLADWKLPDPTLDGSAMPPLALDDPLAALKSRLADAERKVEALGTVAVAPHASLWKIAGTVLLVGGLGFRPAGWVLGSPLGEALWISLVVAGGLTVRVRAFLKGRYHAYHMARGAVEAINVVVSLRRLCLENVNQSYKRERARLKQDKDQAERRAEVLFKQSTDALEKRRRDELEQADEQRKTQLAELARVEAETTREANEKYPILLRENAARHQTLRETILARHAEQVTREEADFEAESARLEEAWEQGKARFHAEVARIRDAVASAFPPWRSLQPSTWKPPEQTPPVIPFGTVEMSLVAPKSKRESSRARTSEPFHAELPALLPLSGKSSLLLKVGQEGRVQAEQSMLSVMLRLLTAMPPGQVRFTILDPVGLGQGFSSLMQLADFEESLVTSRIWTEPQFIGERLADLTEHMETVIQKYLRNEFQTIEEYNARAGEVAEPFRFLVVANFPVNFNDEHARRLVSIVGSGARCGVHTLISVDQRQPMPHQFDLKDLEDHCVTLNWQAGRFHWKGSAIEHCPLTLDVPPPADILPPLLRKIGAAAQHAKRVQVPFEWIAPDPDDWWKGDSRKGIHVPLGRAGAVKRQALRLGEGTSQHVLVAGKTGSGKSTLLHALITNLSLIYSPKEVELYLVDFKKGVEFKVYATHALPHARVVAVESDREFGLSVMQKLDAELRRRGELYRQTGVNDLDGYRRARPEEIMPRILLIVDEFQEWFTEDDKISQDAALLLDRLVRQGRAFGIHVLLGSQTLGGAYSLARSTLGQMAVRIALQCSEADAHLILSEDNSAARLLSRPGEAIYNDSNGTVEGNNPFQVVWLDDEKREEYLTRIDQRWKSLGETTEQIVFEGNVPADITKNPFLKRALAMREWPQMPATYHAWLGEAIEIKDPTAASFRAGSGNNLLLVGQRDEAALATTMNAIVGLSAQLSPGIPEEEAPTGEPNGTRFFILDSTPVDAPIAGQFAKLAHAIPHAISIGGSREISSMLEHLAAELDRRQNDPDRRYPPLFLVVFGLQKFRDLRKQEEDFGFSRATDEPASPAKQFAALIQEGPALGIHVLTWCDSLGNVQRALDRALLREFELRVLFPMSVNDSTLLADSPIAGRLGPHRAVFVREDENRLEKFRPYDLPSDTWLLGARDALKKGP